ncbi:MAG: lipopolysaccharide biosynthesis protein RfbH, partial [Burkholderiales bacterium]
MIPIQVASTLAPAPHTDPEALRLREQIRELVAQYAAITHEAVKPFGPGQTPLPPSGKVIGGPEIQGMVDAALDGWLTTGRFNAAFEQRLSKYLGVPHV